MTSKLSFQMLPNPVGQRAGSGGMCRLLAKVGSMLYHSNYIAKIVYFFRTLGEKKKERRMGVGREWGDIGGDSIGVHEEWM